MPRQTGGNSSPTLDRHLGIFIMFMCLDCTHIFLLKLSLPGFDQGREGKEGGGRKEQQHFHPFFCFLLLLLLLLLLPRVADVTNGTPGRRRRKKRGEEKQSISRKKDEEKRNFFCPTCQIVYLGKLSQNECLPPNSHKSWNTFFFLLFSLLPTPFLC